MRDSGIEFLGEVPSHWDLQPAVTLARVLTSTVDKKSYEGEQSVKLCNYTDVYYSDQIVDSSDFTVATATLEQIAKFSVRAGDVPFTKDSETAADIGIPSYVPKDLPGTVYGYHLSIFRPIDKRRGRFLKYLLESDYAKAYFEARTPGVTRVGLGQATIRYFRAPTPPVEEAVAIADYLDRETAQIDAFIAKNEELITLLTERKRAILPRAIDDLTGETIKLRYLYSPSKQANYPDETVLSVYREHGVVVKSSRSDNFNVTPENLDRYLLVRPEDVVVNRMKAWQGSLGVASMTGIVSGDYEVLRPRRDALLPAYANHLLRSPKLIGQYGARSTGIRPSQWRLYWDQMGDIRVTVPTRDVQERVVREIDERVDTVVRGIQTAERVVSLARERRAALISAAVTGKIDMGVAV